MFPERLAVYTTIYPGVEPFLPRWSSSIRAQTDRDFDLWIGTDGLSLGQLADSLPLDDRLRWSPGRPGDTPGAIRARAITQMVPSYDAVVFVDSDDVLCASRVEAARAALATWDVIGCGLALVDEEVRELPYYLGPPEGADGAALLARCNVFGLSNTAYRCSALRTCLPVARECVLVDWFLATRAWLNGAEIGFDREPRMKYRQHGATMARMLGPFTADDMRQATALVRQHYRLVLAASSPGPRRHEVEAAQARVDRFHRAITDSPRVLRRYVDAVNRQPPGWSWWWWVAVPELEDVWND